jgi:hypothetical protein
LQALHPENLKVRKEYWIYNAAYGLRIKNRPVTIIKPAELTKNAKDARLLIVLKKKTKLQNIQNFIQI